jgi:hypothetical protein
MTFVIQTDFYSFHILEPVLLRGYRNVQITACFESLKYCGRITEIMIYDTNMTLLCLYNWNKNEMIENNSELTVEINEKTNDNTNKTNNAITAEITNTSIYSIMIIVCVKTDGMITSVTNKGTTIGVAQYWKLLNKIEYRLERQCNDLFFTEDKLIYKLSGNDHDGTFVEQNKYHRQFTVMAPEQETNSTYYFHEFLKQFIPQLNNIESARIDLKSTRVVYDYFANMFDQRLFYVFRAENIGSVRTCSSDIQFVDGIDMYNIVPLIDEITTDLNDFFVYRFYGVYVFKDWMIKQNRVNN